MVRLTYVNLIIWIQDLIDLKCSLQELDMKPQGICSKCKRWNSCCPIQDYLEKEGFQPVPFLNKTATQCPCFKERQETIDIRILQEEAQANL